MHRRGVSSRKVRCRRTELTINTVQDTRESLDRPLRGEYQSAILSIRAREESAGGEEVVDGVQGALVEVVGEHGDKFGDEAFGAEEGVVFVFGGGFCFEEEDCR